MSGKVDRERSVNAEQLSAEQLELLAEQIGNKINGMVDDVCLKANEMLKIYGLEAKMQVAIQSKTVE